MNSRQRVMTALELKEPDRVPFVDAIDTVVKHKIMGADEIDEAELAYKIGMDAICFPEYAAPVFCRSHNGGEMQSQAGTSGETEFLGEGLISSEKDLAKMVLPNPHEESFYEPARQFLERYHNSDLAIFAMLRPFGMFNTIYSMPMMAFAFALRDDLKLINTMMDIFAEWNIAVLEKLQGLGVDFFLACNDMAYKAGPLVSPQVFREVFLPKMKDVADAIKIPWAFHSDGDLTLVMEDLLTLGMNAVNPFEPPVMDLKEAKAKWGDRICLWGNIDLVQTLPYGSVEEVEAEVKQRIKEAGQGGGYICASANSITDFCKIENVFAMTGAVKKYGTYPLNID
ncbi:MAG: uroporphyrinogen decarboxylase family protein [Desulfobacterales bacterium]